MFVIVLNDDSKKPCIEILPGNFGTCMLIGEGVARMTQASKS